MSTDTIRLLVLWCPDWPVAAAGAAAGTPPLAPAAVFSANRVVTCSAAAQATVGAITPTVSQVSPKPTGGTGKTQARHAVSPGRTVIVAA